MNPKRRVRQVLFLCLGFLMGTYAGTCAAFADTEVSSADANTVTAWKSRISVTYSVDGSSSGKKAIFILRGVTADTPMPAGAGISSEDGAAAMSASGKDAASSSDTTDSEESDIGDTGTDERDSVRTLKLTLKPNSSGDFGEITYTSPGIYQYEVRRQGVEDSRVKNSSLDDSVYRVTMVVRTDGDIQQVRETDGEKVTEIHYEDYYDAASPLEIVKTGDMSALRMPVLGLAICSFGLAILLWRRGKKAEAAGLALSSATAMDATYVNEGTLRQRSDGYAEWSSDGALRAGAMEREASDRPAVDMDKRRKSGAPRAGKIEHEMNNRLATDLKARGMKGARWAGATELEWNDGPAVDINKRNMDGAIHADMMERVPNDRPTVDTKEQGMKGMQRRSTALGEKMLQEEGAAGETGASGTRWRRKKERSKERRIEGTTILEEERLPLSEYWKMMSLALILSLTLGMVGASVVPASAATKDLTVTYNQFEDLPENYVRIIGLPLNEATFTTTNSNIKKFNGYIGNNQTSKRDFIGYYGTVKYGTKNRTETADASTASNTISGTITLRWSNQALLSDNTKADVKVVVSNWKFNLGKRTNSNITDSTKVYVPILQEAIAGSNETELCSSSPRTSCSTNTGTKTDTLTGAAIQAECQVKIQILKSGTDEAIDSTKYPRMLFGFRDLDVADSSLASNKTAAVRYNGAHAEGIELISGFESPVCLAQKTNTNPSMQTLVKASTVGNNLRISGDGAKYETYNNATGTTGDDGTYYSGFISPVTPQEFTFKWTGSVTTTGKMLGTALWSQPEVAVKATAGEGGAIEKEGTTTYIINSSTTYDYTPSPGYKVKSLTVEGSAVDFDEEGGTYKFEKLYTSPATERSSSTGKTTSTKVYTIDVQFQRIEHQITTKVTNGTIDESCVVGDGEDKTIHYEPNEGYELEKITVDGEIVDPDDNAKQYGFYSVQEDHHIEVVYTKIPAAKLSLRKQVTGALGDRSKAFEFEIRLRGLPPLRAFRADGLESADVGTLNETGFISDENGEAVLHLTLKDDESAYIEELPRDTIYQVIESASNHTASYQQTGTGDSPHFEQASGSNTDSDVNLAMQEETMEVCDGDIEIVYTNDRPIATITGIGDSDTPYFVMGAILMVLSGGRLIYVLKYRRKY